MVRAELTEPNGISEVELNEDDDQYEKGEFEARDSRGSPDVFGKSKELNDKIREIVVPVVDANSDGKILRYACELARLFSARIALVYSVPEPELSEGILEFTRIENYKDFYPDYVQAIGNLALGKMERRLNKEGIEFRKIITNSNPKDIVNQLVNGTGTETVAIVLKTGSKHYGFFAKLGFMKTLAPTIIMESKVPIFTIP